MTQKQQKFFFVSSERRSQKANKSLSGTLLTTFTTMKFYWYHTMHEHVNDTTNNAQKLNL